MHVFDTREGYHEKYYAGMAQKAIELEALRRTID
jgi:hypothetical protein